MMTLYKLSITALDWIHHPHIIICLLKVISQQKKFHDSLTATISQNLLLVLLLISEHL